MCIFVVKILAVWFIILNTCLHLNTRKSCMLTANCCVSFQSVCGQIGKPELHAVSRCVLFVTVISLFVFCLPTIAGQWSVTLCALGMIINCPHQVLAALMTFSCEAPHTPIPTNGAFRLSLDNALVVCVASIRSRRDSSAAVVGEETEFMSASSGSKTDESSSLKKPTPSSLGAAQFTSPSASESGVELSFQPAASQRQRFANYAFAGMLSARQSSGGESTDAASQMLTKNA